MAFFATAITDIKAGIGYFQLWQTLARQDIKLKYRRSTLGPFWITLSMAVSVSAMGPLYGSLFSLNAEKFVPHLTLGLIFWAFIAGALNEYAESFTSNEYLLKQAYLPLSLLVMRVFYRQFIILGHNLLIYPFVMLFLGLKLNYNIFWFIPSFLIVSINILSLGLIISIFCTRFRDMLPVIQSIVTLLFFISPIIWQINQLPINRRYLAEWNPFTSFLSLLREPILGQFPTGNYWLIASCSALFLGTIALWTFNRTRNYITYWL